MRFNKTGGYFGEALKNRFCYKLLANQYYFPHMIEKIILKPYLALSKFSWKELDSKLIDAMVDGIANSIYLTGVEGKAMQSGNLSSALKWMVFGIFVLLTLVVTLGGMR